MQPKRELRIRKVDKGLGQGKEEALPRKDTERGKDRRRSICHGLTRNYTEKTEAETRKRRRNSHGNKTLLSEPDA